MTGQDLEISAMAALAAALEPLEEDARRRVLGWGMGRYCAPSNVPHSPAPPATSTIVGQLESFAELHDAAAPKTDKERALVAAYWVQICAGQPNFPAQTLNSNLKDLGHGLGNITDALEGLKEEKPALILQLKKSGTSKQARKVYRLTQEGAKRVQQMLSKEQS